MPFNKHSNLQGKHALLSPSNYHWINYDEDRLEERVVASFAARRGSELHDLACQLIRLGVKLPRTQATLNMYVNDAINYGMEPELCVYYSENCFGHADALSFRRGLLRIHDLKTGKLPGSEHQLRIYAAIFCLEYIISPFEIETELRIYQNDEVVSFNPNPEVIVRLMDKIIYSDQKIEMLKEEGVWQ